MERECLDLLVKAARDLKSAIAKCERARRARATLPPGSTRARVTTANARWQTAAEAAERARGVLVIRMTRLVNEFGLLEAAHAMWRSWPEFDGRHLEEEVGNG